jgi:NADPH:quinone reductase-like Zn-dependent oxidoreductase
MTAHYLNSTYKLQNGALIHAAAGGVGLLLVQMAKKIGARVIATAGTEEKVNSHVMPVLMSASSIHKLTLKQKLSD